MDIYVLFRAEKRVTLRLDDMTTEKISVIFKVCICFFFLFNVTFKTILVVITWAHSAKTETIANITIISKAK